MTKEQRERARLLVRMQPVTNDEDADVLSCVVVMLSDEAEADRKLGESVRDCFKGVTPKKAARIAITIASECEDGSFSEMVFSAIAKALREEGER